MDVRMVLPGYIEAMDMRLVRGRGINDGDGPSGRAVVMINESLARITWPGEDPVGKLVMLDYLGGAYPYEVVGVVNDTRHGLRREARPEVFIPYRQNAYPALFFVLKSSMDPARLIGLVRQAVKTTDPSQPAQRIATMQTLVEATLGRERLAMRLFGGMALIALLLAAIGIAGIVEYAVSQSTRDIGLRMALGARPLRVVTEIMAQSGRPLLLGLTVGGALLWPLLRGLRGMLFGVSPDDPATLFSSALVLLIVGLVAAAVPSSQASRVDPSSALRAD